MGGGWIIRGGSGTSGFLYTDEEGRPVRDARVLARVEALRIPPGWRDVHVAPSPESVLQAWGIDGRGRKQYVYHQRAVQTREARKYFRVRRLARDLPRIRAALHQDLTRDGTDRQRVAAAVVRLISKGFFRIGNERYVRENNTYGLVTLHKEHVRVAGELLAFSYTGKWHRAQHHTVVDGALAGFLERLLREAPGQRVFRYRSADGWCDLTAREVNEYIQRLSGVRYTAKDFRTWGGTVRVATVLSDLGPPASAREAQRNVAMAVRFVAAELGNTPAICRASYVHPMVIARYVDAGETIVPASGSAGLRSPSGHDPEERALIRFLYHHFRPGADGDAPRCTWRRERKLLAAICSLPAGSPDGVPQPLS
jgi:DNA topoisomerase-1